STNFGLLSVAGNVSVDVSSSVTHLDTKAVNTVFAAEGNLFANDLDGVDGLPLSVSKDGVSFEAVLEGAPTVILGDYGTLELHADGAYTYTPDDRAQAGGETDTFTYRVEHLDGSFQDATLTVTVNVSTQG